jgi:uncharacterized Ntn-hydrolase superfamily protein
MRIDDRPPPGWTFPATRSSRRGTYSTVARDPETGALGVAVQSHWFSVGSAVPAAEAGVGAVATQSNFQPRHRALALRLLREGRTAAEALAGVMESDPLVEHRQTAIVDAAGRVAVHTGSACIDAAGHSTGEGFTCQANIMRSDAVWPAMSAAYQAGAGLPFPARLLAVLEAAEAAGGDLRGRQSAAMLIVPADGDPVDRLVDVRVEDSADPLGELRRLLRLNDAYVLGDAGDTALAAGDLEAAARLYLAAYETAPQSDELRFWASLGLLGAGVADRGASLLQQTVDADPAWREVLLRLRPDVDPSRGRGHQVLGLAEAAGA